MNNNELLYDLIVSASVDTVDFNEERYENYKEVYKTLKEKIESSLSEKQKECLFYMEELMERINLNVFDVGFIKGLEIGKSTENIPDNPQEVYMKTTDLYEGDKSLLEEVHSFIEEY